MVIKIIAKLGHQRIVKNFIDFIVNLIPNKNEKLQIMYGIDGQKEAVFIGWGTIWPSLGPSYDDTVQSRLIYARPG